MKTQMIALILTLLVWGHNTKGNTPLYYGSGEAPTSNGFTLVKTMSGVSIYTRWIPADASRLGKQVKAAFTVSATPAEILRFLQRDSSFTAWMNGTSRYYRVKSIDENQWYSYVQFAIPWPFNNQDCVIRYEVQPAKAGEVIRVKMTGMPACVKNFEGIKRIQHMEGWWILTEVGGNQTRVEYIMFSNQKPEFPRWITDPIIQKSLVKTMSAFREMAGKSK